MILVTFMWIQPLNGLEAGNRIKNVNMFFPKALQVLRMFKMTKEKNLNTRYLVCAPQHSLYHLDTLVIYDVFSRFGHFDQTSHAFSNGYYQCSINIGDTLDKLAVYQRTKQRYHFMRK